MFLWRTIHLLRREFLDLVWYRFRSSLRISSINRWEVKSEKSRTLAEEAIFFRYKELRNPVVYRCSTLPHKLIFHYHSRELLFHASDFGSILHNICPHLCSKKFQTLADTFQPYNLSIFLLWSVQSRTRDRLPMKFYCYCRLTDWSCCFLYKDSRQIFEVCIKDPAKNGLKCASFTAMVFCLFGCTAWYFPFGSGNFFDEMSWKSHLETPHLGSYPTRQDWECLESSMANLHDTEEYLHHQKQA